jgi:predicted metal-binding membrane protein
VNARTALESLLRRDRWLLVGPLVLAVVLCWAWIVPMARGMYGAAGGPSLWAMTANTLKLCCTPGAMTGLSAWMMPAAWDLLHLLLLFAMWVVMMAGMMLPSAAPALLLYAGVIRHSPEAARAPAHVYAFAGGYLAVWTTFSLLATVLQRLFSEWMFLSPMMESQNPAFGAAVLLVAGLYQLTPFKRTCLSACRSPAEFLTRHWKPGVAGGFHLGVANGLYCLGCCWALMLLLFVGGVMNLWWIAAITVFVLLEKLAPYGAQGGRLSGLLISALGIWSLVAG